MLVATEICIPLDNFSRDFFNLLDLSINPAPLGPLAYKETVSQADCIFIVQETSVICHMMEAETVLKTMEIHSILT
jgi:hypothetical protein